MIRAAERAALALGLALGAGGPALAGEPARVGLVCDLDDDDADGIPDAAASFVGPAPELARLPNPGRGAYLGEGRGLGGARLLVDGKPLAVGAAIPAGGARVELQGARPGRGEIAIGGSALRFGAVEIGALDARGRRVDPARSHVSFTRQPPASAATGARDPDGIRLVAIGDPRDLPARLHLTSVGPDGEPVAALAALALEGIACPADVKAPLACRATRPLRVVADPLDRAHPASRGRAILARLGGALLIQGPRGEKLQALRVGGPRGGGASGLPHVATLRVFVLRARPGGPPAIGADDAEARCIALGEVERARVLWAPCGIDFRVATGTPSVVDPPAPDRIVIGDGLGLPASGGTVSLRVDGREVALRVERGARPSEVARALLGAIRRQGFDGAVRESAAISLAALASADLAVRRRDGSPAVLALSASGKLTDDPTLSVRLGEVALDRGLRHFGDVDAAAGTVEERALALAPALDDGDPSTIEVLFVPAFAAGHRMGEAFIRSDRGAISSAVVLDRAGVRAAGASSVLAHELGHVLLDDPAHPDEFGVDTPTRLMDGDAASPGAFGPRRLDLAECARAFRRSGPEAPIPLLELRPFGPLGRRR